MDCSKNEPISVYKRRNEPTKRPSKRRHEVENVALVDSEKKTVNITTWATTGNAKIICTKETMRLEYFKANGKFVRMGKISRGNPENSLVLFKPGAHESYLLTAKFIRATCNLERFLARMNKTLRGRKREVFA